MQMRYLDRTLATIEANLALDEALLVVAEERGGPAVLRQWEAPEVVVVMGASCRLRDEVRVEACREDGVAIVRRSTGGGTVVIGPGALNVAVVLPIDIAPGLEAVDVAQRFVLERMAKGLRTLEPNVEVLGSGDLTIDRRKFGGSAQRRLRKHFLVHVSLLYHFPLELVDRYTTLPRRQPAYRTGRSHHEFLMNLERAREQIATVVHSSWISPGPPIAANVPEALVDHLVATKFGDPAWIGRL